MKRFSWMVSLEKFALVHSNIPQPLQIRGHPQSMDIDTTAAAQLSGKTSWPKEGGRFALCVN